MNISHHILKQLAESRALDLRNEAGARRASRPKRTRLRALVAIARRSRPSITRGLPGGES